MNRRIVGFVEGFLATTGTDRYGRTFTVEQIHQLRDEVESKPWLFMGLARDEPPAGRVSRVEVRQLGSIIGLWGRVEFYQASALKITSEGILNFFGFTTPSHPIERRTPEDVRRYEALRQDEALAMDEELARYQTPPVQPPPPYYEPPAYEPPRQPAAYNPIPEVPPAPRPPAMVEPWEPPYRHPAPQPPDPRWEPVASRPPQPSGSPDFRAGPSYWEEQDQNGEQSWPPAGEPVRFQPPRDLAVPQRAPRREPEPEPQTKPEPQRRSGRPSRQKPLAADSSEQLALDL